MHRDQLTVDVDDLRHHRRQMNAVGVPAGGRPAQCGRWENGDVAPSEIGRHRASARVVSGIPDPPATAIRRAVSSGATERVGIGAGR